MNKNFKTIENYTSLNNDHINHYPRSKLQNNKNRIQSDQNRKKELNKNDKMIIGESYKQTINPITVPSSSNYSD